MTEMISCPCTTYEQDESCPVGYPSQLCWACGGIGRTTIDKVVALSAEMMRIADEAGETSDPFAAWESLRILDAHTAEQPALELCDVCGGHGMAGHPDSGYLCSRCHGSGGIKPAPDVVAEAAKLADDIEHALTHNAPVTEALFLLAVAGLTLRNIAKGHQP